jgi:hypothetical protein
MRICFVTIASANYLAYVGVLAASVARHAGDAEFRVLVVDEPSSAVRAAVAQTGLSAVYARDLPLPSFDRVAYQYDLVELNTALKPSFIKATLDDGFEAVVYLDPDICLYAHPAPILEALEGAPIVVTPHAMAPAMDGLRPSDIDFLRNGAFNLGFVAVREADESRSFLDWWERRCLHHGFNDPGFGTFVDQKWIDLVPVYFPCVRILRHRGCNVAYWNLHERQVRWDAGAYRVGDEALVFFHFSGVKAEAPTVLSRHQTRHRIEAGTAVSLLVAEYCKRLIDAGHEQFRQIPYSYACLDNGTTITPTMRRALGACGAAAGNPFLADSEIQRRLRMSVVRRSTRVVDVGTRNTLTLDQSDRRLRWVNAFIRLLARLFGVERVRALLQYASFLSRQSHYAAVLLERPFDVTHDDR